MSKSEDPAYIKSLHARLTALQEQYALHFAHQMRLTRNLAMLDALTSEVHAIVHEASAWPAPSAALQQALTAAKELEAACRQERDAIAQAQEKAGPQAIQAMHLLTRASFVTHRYTRHYEGKERTSRSVGMLDEMLIQATALAAEIQKLGGATDALHKHIEVFTREHAALVALRETEPAALYAAANELLTIYDARIVNRGVLSCRLSLLAWLIAELQSIAARIEPQPLLQKALQDFQSTFEQVQTAQKSATREARITALTDAAQSVLDEYNAGVEGSQQDLSALCDRLDDIELQLSELAGTSDVTVMVRDVFVILQLQVERR